MTPDQMKELAARLRAYAWAIDSLDFDLHDENAVDIRAAADLIEQMAARSSSRLTVGEWDSILLWGGLHRAGKLRHQE